MLLYKGNVAEESVEGDEFEEGHAGEDGLRGGEVEEGRETGPGEGADYAKEDGDDGDEGDGGVGHVEILWVVSRGSGIIGIPYRLCKQDCRSTDCRNSITDQEPGGQEKHHIPQSPRSQNGLPQPQPTV